MAKISCSLPEGRYVMVKGVPCPVFKDHRGEDMVTLTPQLYKEFREALLKQGGDTMYRFMRGEF